MELKIEERIRGPEVIYTITGGTEQEREDKTLEILRHYPTNAYGTTTDKNPK